MLETQESKLSQPEKWPILTWLLVSGLLILTFNGLYLLLFVKADLFYVVNVLLHFLVGLLIIPLLLLWGVGLFHAKSKAIPQQMLKRISFVILLVAIGIGVTIAIVGGLRKNQWLVDTHMTVAGVGVTLFMLGIGIRRVRMGVVQLSDRLKRSVVMFLGVLLLPAVLWGTKFASIPNGPVIHNPDTPPMTMHDEAMGGKDGPFFPSSSSTNTGGTIPSSFFTESEKACKRCHSDIYTQWQSSAHHFSSFNNPWYRKSIEYMQEVNGIQPSKWCGGCHDPAVLFSGMMDRPVREIADTVEGQAGLGCMSCHSITKVKSTMGQGDYYMEYPLLHKLAVSDDMITRVATDFVIHLSPEVHRRTFLKPFHRSKNAQGAEFCSVCHKVHLDVPVNNYRWFRGFNEYDAWQASGVSGQGARSFYYPSEPKGCGGCHMPLVPSGDKGNVEGMVHSHRFPGANTALPTVNKDKEQLKTVMEFLKGAVSVDIFAVSRELKGVQAASSPKGLGHRNNMATSFTMFSVGEEAQGTGHRQPTKERLITAPIDETHVAIRRGESVLVDVVVRNRKTGHFFPGGTVDAFDVWVEFKATDSNGKVLFRSGAVKDNGKGPVEEGAHFYRSYLLDAHGNHINKRNVWAARSLLYSRLIPPGAADTVHYRLDIPQDARGPITLEARVNYRKFMWWNTQFVFKGMRDSTQGMPNVTKDYDDGLWNFDPSKSAPDLPIVVVAESKAILNVVNQYPAFPHPESSSDPKTRERWNDYGIGLFLQGDLRHAERAFLKVTELDPTYADGWVNVARVRIEEGNSLAAIPVLKKALEIDPHLAKAYYFKGLSLKAQGNYEEALTAFRQVAKQYPRDRVVRNEIGKIIYLLGRFDESVNEIQKVLKIDPEDLSAHYTLMLNYRALGKKDLAAREQQLYFRFKADEAAQTITGDIRRADPHANNERQGIHDHRSMPLPAIEKDKKKAL